MADPIAALPAVAGWQLKDYVGVAGFAISLVLAVVKGIEFYKSRNDRSKDQRAKVDDAWFKTIALDDAVPALRSFLETQKVALKKAGTPATGVVRPHISALQNYLQESEDLKSRLKSVEELSTNAYETMVRALEDLDDLISPYCAHADDGGYDRKVVADEWLLVGRQFDKCFRTCLSVLRKVHYALQQARDPNEDIHRPAST